MGVGTPACSKFYVAIDNAACSPLGIVIIDKCFKVYSVIVHLWVNLHSVMPFVANFNFVQHRAYDAIYDRVMNNQFTLFCYKSCS